MKAPRKVLIASAVAMALSGSAYAGTTFFDINGGDAGGGAKVSTFDWAPDNMLIINTTPAGETATGDGALITLVAQGKLSSLLGPVLPVGGLGTNTFTYQMKTFLELNLGGSDADTIAYRAPNPAVAGTFFEIYYSPTNLSNQFTGCGYGAHQSAFCGGAAAAPALIYRGTATMKIGSTSKLEQTDITQPAPLDQFTDGPTGPGNSKGVTTQDLDFGSITLDVNTVTFDPLFFTSIVTALTIDISHVEKGATSPFTTVTPSDEVLGSAGDGAVTKRTDADKEVFFGQDGAGPFVWLNDIGGSSCPGPGATTGGGDDVCGVQLESDSSSTVQGFVPEPHSLALLGLGLAGLGLSTRRRRAKPAAV